ncbi:peptidase C60 sortase A and B [Kocuria rosea subsp. polaris]|uniref:Peptidase C60 sortase A and B n=1 Tax=Kocuria rosea subsp. polaris TaxID=136273 RepID=A0A0W8IPG9_KOCRO|nr:peptidase C60 sortase A and B [Kocuria polaris]
MTVPTAGRRRDRLVPAAAALLLLSGCAGGSPAQPAAPPSSASSSVSAPPTQTPAPAPTAAPGTAAPGPDAAPAPEAQPPVLAQSAPVAVRIPAVGASSGLLHLGLRPDGSLEVPPTHPGAPASWYTSSPTPGERGPAVLLGHVNATGGGSGVFAGLRGLVPGDTVEIDREDGSTAVFVVERGEQYAKNAFPTRAVYGNTAGAELRLITCDGYDPATGLFDDNYVVYARLAA